MESKVLKQTDRTRLISFSEDNFGSSVESQLWNGKNSGKSSGRKWKMTLEPQWCRDTSDPNIGGLGKQPGTGSAGDGGPKMSQDSETFGDCYLEKNKEYQRRCVLFGWGWGLELVEWLVRLNGFICIKFEMIGYIQVLSLLHATGY